MVSTRANLQHNAGCESSRLVGPVEPTPHRNQPQRRPQPSPTQAGLNPPWLGMEPLGAVPSPAPDMPGGSTCQTVRRFAVGESAAITCLVCRRLHTVLLARTHETNQAGFKPPPPRFDTQRAVHASPPSASEAWTGCWPRRRLPPPPACPLPPPAQGPNGWG